MGDYLINRLKQQSLDERRSTVNEEFDIQQHERILQQLANPHKIMQNWTCNKCLFAVNPSSRANCLVCKSEKYAHSSTFNVATLPWLQETHITPLEQFWETITTVTIEDKDNIAEAMKHLYGTIRSHEENKTMFVDTEFPPDALSFYRKPHVEQNRFHKWMRIRHTMVYEYDSDFQWCLFQPIVYSTDIVQGDLDDCWLLSVLAALAVRDDLLRQIILNFDICPQGVYMVKLCKDGLWTTVLIDDFVPCNKKRYMICALSARKQLWMPLIEKAVAKLYGCYESVELGSSADGFSLLTGAPCQTLFLQSLNEQDEIDEMWQKLLSLYDSGFVLVASCGGKAMKEDCSDQCRKMGLKSYHAYSILKIKIMNGNRLLQLHNPWGYTDWNGRWCETSSEWTPLLRAALQQSEESLDGVFWICYADLLKLFDVVDVCMIRDRWLEYRLSGLLPPFAYGENSSIIELTILETTEVDFVLYQDCQRQKPYCERQFLDLFLIITSTESNNATKFIGYSRKKLNTFVYHNEALNPGKYSVIPVAFNHWQRDYASANDFPRYTLAIHSLKAVKAEKIICPMYAVTDALISLVVKCGVALEDKDKIVHYFENWPGAITVIENCCPNNYMHITCDYTSENIEMVSSRGSLKTVDSIPPLHLQICNIITHNGRDWLQHYLPCTYEHKCLDKQMDMSGIIHSPALDSKMQWIHEPRPIIK